jgi:hypothetical protein
MSWEQVVGNGGDIVKLGEAEGQVPEVVGVYLDVKQGQYGPLYVLETEGGKLVSVGSNKDLEEKLDPATMLEKLVRIKYEGTKSIKGGKTFKMFGVSAFTGTITPELATKYPSLAKQITVDAPSPAKGKGKAADLSEKPVALQAEDEDLPF